METLKNLKVLVLGDTIIDEYHYTMPLGQSAKGHHLAVKYQSAEQFAGGVLAVASHIAGFVGNVTLVTALGSHWRILLAKYCTSRLRAANTIIDRFGLAKAI